MTNNNALESVYLVKWPRLLVVGDDVTREQANEIIVRTTHLHYIGTNDRKWQDAVYSAFDVPGELTHFDYQLDTEARLAKVMARERAVERRVRELGILHLYYLETHQVASNNIAGPYGWCDWDGHIGTSEYNIGKWPTAEEVNEDVEQLAAAFPFLNMTVQLVNSEYREDVVDPEDGYGSIVHDEFAAVTWTIAKGTSTYDTVGRPLITQPTGDSSAEIRMHLSMMFTKEFRERGVTMPRLREAIAQVERTYVPPQEDEDGHQ